jgi:hypothetical protein
MPKAMSLIELKAKMGNPMAQATASMLWKWSGIMPFIKFIPHNDLTYSWLEEGNLPEVGGRGLNEDFADQEEPKDNRKFLGMAILGGKIKTDVVHIEQKGPGARTARIARKIRAAARMFDRLFLKGDAQKNPKKEFNGLYKLIAGGQLLTNATNGATPDHKKVVAVLDAVEGPNTEKLLLMNRNVRRGLSIDVGTSAGGRNVMDVGKQLVEFEGAKILEVFKDETENDILPFTEVCGTSGATCSSIICVRLGQDMPEDGVQAISGLSQTINARGPIDFGSYVADYIHFLTAIAMFNKYSAARLQGIQTV